MTSFSGLFPNVPVVQANERDRQLRGTPIAGFFRDAGFALFEYRDSGYKAKLGRDSGVHGKKNFYPVSNENSRQRF